MRLADGHGLTSILAKQEMQVGHVDALVVIGIYRSCRAEESHCTSVLVQHGRLANGGNGSVEGHDVARGGYPKGEVGIGEGLEVVEAQHRFVRNLVGTTMSHVVHHQRACGLLLFNDARYFGVSVARCARFSLKHIPHHLFNKVLWMLCC